MTFESTAAGRPEVIRIPTRAPVNCYAIRDEGVVLVDCSLSGRTRVIERALANHDLRLEDVRLILVTHAHVDHAGSAAALRARTGAPIAAHRADQVWMETGRIDIPAPVTTRGVAMAWITRLLLVPFINFPRARVDIVLGEGDFDLAPYGVPGVVRATPGHTAGSVSVLLPGSVIVGDMAMNGFPFRSGPGLPLAADDLPRLVESWRSLLATHEFDTVYPGHGDSFPADVIRREVDLFSNAGP